MVGRQDVKEGRVDVELLYSIPNSALSVPTLKG